MIMRTILVAALAVAMNSRTPPAAAQCLGDFNGDSKVSVDELLTAVRNSLDDCQLSGARFVDNGDGTVTDHETGLVWEKKDHLDGSTNPSDPHDADNLYVWSSSGTAPDGTVFTAFLFGLNGGTSPDGVATSGCFTGHCDWRVPTMEELSGILDETLGSCVGGDGPCIDPAFGPTPAEGYWSATTFSRNATRAWLLDFSTAGKAEGGKDVQFFVRAVRGG